MDSKTLSEKYVIESGKSFSLAAVDPSDTAGLDIAKGDAKEMLQSNIERLEGLQERLYAEGTRALLVVLQAMDTAGKDSAIKHVMSGINPQGCDVRAFKQPSHLEMAHDFLWRHAVAMPARGRIGIHNRSHYEEVLVTRVHPEILRDQGFDPTAPDFWKHRFTSIRNFEKHLARNGTKILKFFFHISPQEQARRLVSRIDTPGKTWKFAVADVREREHWDEYMAAYEDMIRNTARSHAPWYVVPANDKWFSRLVMSGAIVEALETLNPRFPSVSQDDRKPLSETRDRLVAEAEEPATTKAA